MKKTSKWGVAVIGYSFCPYCKRSVSFTCSVTMRVEFEHYTITCGDCKKKFGLLGKKG